MDVSHCKLLRNLEISFISEDPFFNVTLYDMIYLHI